MQVVGSSRLPKRLLRHPVVPRVAHQVRAALVLPAVETVRKVIGPRAAPAVTVEAEAVAAIAVAPGPAVVGVAVASAAAPGPAVAVDVLAGVATATYRAAKCAPSA